MFKKKTLIACVHAAVYWQALSLSQVHAEHLSLDPVEVTAEAIPEQEKNPRHVDGDTARLLEDEPALSFYRAGGLSSLPALHGLADDRIKIKIDGMDLISSCANHMNPPLSYMAPQQVGSFQVFAGVSPVSLGGDSIAGTILVNSPAPEFSDSEALLTHASLGTFYKSNNDARGVQLEASVANQEAYLRYSGSSTEANNYHAGDDFKTAGFAATNKRWLDADEVGSSYYRAINHAIAFGVQRDHHLVEFKLGLQQIPDQGFPNQRMDMTDNDAQHYNLKYVGSYDWGKLEARAYHERVRHRMNFGEDKQFFYGLAPGMPMDTLGLTTGLNLMATLDLNPRDTLRLGTELQRYRLDDYWSASGTGMMMSPNTFLNINNGQRDKLDLFAEWDAQWNPEWFTQFGVRASQIAMDTGRVQGYNNTTMGMAGYATAANIFNALDREQTDHNWNVTALAKYQPSAQQEYQVGYAMKTRSPNLYERYTWANTNTMVMNMNNWYGDGNGYVGNLDLDPETAHTFSATADWHDASKQNWQLKITPYFTYVEDYIDAVSCASIGKTCPNRTDGFVNLTLDNQTAHLYGIDMQGKKQLAENGWGKWTLTGLMRYVRGKNTESHDDLYNIMPLNTRLGLEHVHGGWKNRLEVSMVASKDRVQAIRQELETKGYSLVNLYSSYAWSHARFDLGVENLFDKYYEDPLGGAYLGQGATMGTGVLQGVQVPGMGRSVNVGLTLFY